MRILLESKESSFSNRVDYVLRFINEHPGCPQDVNISSSSSDFDIKIKYGGEQEQDQYFIPAQRMIFSNEIFSSESLSLNEYDWKDQKVYGLEKDEKTSNSFIVDKQFQFDIIETIFFHLSRYEEYHCAVEDKDQWDAMKEDKQILVRANCEKIPVVDRLVIAFLEALGITPNNLKTKYRITHDIDLIKKFKSPLSFLRFTAYYLKNGHGLGSIKELLKSYYRNVFQGEKPYDVFDEMLLQQDIEKEIYFLVGGDTPVDTPLDTSSEIFKRAISQSKSRGYKIGIHPSYATWKDLSLFRKEKQLLEEIIGEEITISRQHYLHFSFNHTIDILTSCGIKQDSTIGYNRRVGFRAGTGCSFYLYDLKQDKATDIVEEPLSFMDSSLCYESGFDPLKFSEIAKSFLEENSLDTMITFNFHNSRFDDAKMFGLPQDQLYKEIVNG